jgi:proteasome lid subunit RPN8/RPN11
MNFSPAPQLSWRRPGVFLDKEALAARTCCGKVWAGRRRPTGGSLGPGRVGGGLSLTPREQTGMMVMKKQEEKPACGQGLTMWQVLVQTASRFLRRFQWIAARELWESEEAVSPPVAAPAPRVYRRLVRVVLTDLVSRTLFEEYAAHRQSQRGEEETGWVLLGLRELDEAIVLATLPAGAERSAGISHVRFNACAQALASRIVRQEDRRLTMLGVVHTHPGSLRHPSDGDFQGDSQWVQQLRGGEGIFGIGTAEDGSAKAAWARQPAPHMQLLGPLCFSWYALGRGDRRYRPLPVALTLGPDLARPLHPLWHIIERHAEPLERLYRQQARVRFSLLEGLTGPALGVDIALANPDEGLRLILEEKEVRYYLVRQQELLRVNLEESQVDRGVYLILAELAAGS